MKMCCQCGSTFSDRHDEKCDVCLGEHFNKEFAIGEKVRVGVGVDNDESFNGMIIGTATIVRNGQLFQQYVVEADIYFYAPANVGLTNIIVCHRDNIVSLYRE